MSKLLGKGAYGKVYARGDVAIKCIKISDSISSAIREICILRACAHKNIIRLVNVEYSEKYIKLYSGRYHCDLYTYLKNYISLPLGNLYTCAYDLLSAVAYIHSRGIIHCDIKPQNILVDMQSPDSFSLLLCDFGISVLTYDKYHTSNVQTDIYRAPEINIEDKLAEYSTHIDMWSLGCILFEMAAGDSPFGDICFNEDTSYYACALFNVAPEVDLRSARMEILDNLSFMHILHKIRSLLCCRMSTPHYTELDNVKYIELIAQCLIPNKNKRISAQCARVYVHECDEIINDVPSIGAWDVIDVNFCGYSSEFLQFSTHIFNNYMLRFDPKKYDMKKYDDTNIRCACIFIASCVFFGAYRLDEKKIAKNILYSTVFQIMFVLDNNLL